MPATCEIEFGESPRRIVYAGQLLSGMVQLNLTKNTNVRSVYVRIKGTAFATWTEIGKILQVGGTCLDRSLYVEGYRGSTDKISLKTGTHIYIFRFRMPSDIPSSIVGIYGHINYTFQVVLDVPLWMNKVFKVPITVIKPLNLNDYPSLRQPIIVEKTNYVRFSGSKTFTITARAPVRGFLPLETVDLEINVRNQSSVTIPNFRVELIQRIFYSCKGYEKEEKKYLYSKKIDGCSGNEYKIFRLAVQIPQTLPTEIFIFFVTYSIRMTALMPALYKNRFLDLPITIGSHPFQDGPLQQ